MKIKEIGHVAFRCKDNEKEMEFYTEKLGLKKAFDLRNDDGDVFISYLKLANGQYIELFPNLKTAISNKYVGDKKRCDHSHQHVCLTTEDRFGVREELRDKGIDVVHRADENVGPCGSYCQFITDPEDNQWEIMEFTRHSLQIISDKA